MWIREDSTEDTSQSLVNQKMKIPWISVLLTKAQKRILMKRISSVNKPLILNECVCVCLCVYYDMLKKYQYLISAQNLNFRKDNTMCNEKSQTFHFIFHNLRQEV